MTIPYPTPDALWQAALGELRLQLLRATYDAWLNGSQAVASASGPDRLVVAVRSPYAPAWLTQRLGNLIHATLAELAGRPLPVSYVTTAGALPAGDSAQPDSPTLSTPVIQQGETTMSNQSQTSVTTTPAVNGHTRARLYSHVTQSRFLHIEDSLQIGKLRLFAGTYRRNQGMQSHAVHFLDLADARVIFSALAGGEPAFSHKEYKGTPAAGGRESGGAVSRVLSVAVKEENVYIELKSGPGQVTATGAITPAGQPATAVNVGFKRYEARRMALTVLAYLAAWDVARILAHKRLVSPPPPYLLVPAGGEREALSPPAANGGPVAAPSPAGNGSGPPAQPQPDSPARPVTRRDLPAQGNGRPAALRYGDGTAVDAANRLEVQTFRSYLAARQVAPASKSALLAYYREGAG